MKHNKTKIQAFTMVELMVAMSLFIVIVTMASQGFIRNIRTQRATAVMISANSNAAAALEQMMREMRTGKDFGQSAVNSADLTFTNAAGDTVEYTLNIGTQAIQRNVNGFGARPITASDVGVLTLQFVLFGHQAGDSYPPRITITLQVTPVGLQGLDIPIVNLQTTISAREIDT